MSGGALTEAEKRFFELLGMVDELTQFTPDEADVNFIPRTRWKQDLWEAAKAIRDEALAGKRWEDAR